MDPEHKTQNTERETRNIEPGTRYEIPVAGSLGLLALGAKGIQLWRKAKQEAAARLKNEQTSPGDEKK